MKSCLKDNVIEMYSAQNEGKFAVRTLKNKICKYMTNVSVGKLDSIVDNYSNT